MDDLSKANAAPTINPEETTEIDPTTVILDPITGEIIDETSLDSLAAAALRIKTVKDKLWNSERAIKEKIAAMARGDAKTQKVRGVLFQAEVVRGDVSWSQPMLKAAYNEIPTQYRDELLRVSEVAVNANAWKSWQKTTGTPEFEAIKSRIAAACQGVTSAPSVKVNEIDKNTLY